MSPSVTGLVPVAGGSRRLGQLLPYGDATPLDHTPATGFDQRLCVLGAPAGPERLHSSLRT
jgi:hypothetical protein